MTLLIVSAVGGRLNQSPVAPPFSLVWRDSGGCFGTPYCMRLRWDGQRGFCRIQDPEGEAVVSEPLSATVALQLRNELDALPLEQLRACTKKFSPGIGPAYISFEVSSGSSHFVETFDDCANPYAVQVCSWRDRSYLGRVRDRWLPLAPSLLDHP